MIMNYEKQIRKELIKGLTGKSVIVNDDETVSIGATTSYTGVHPDGFIPHLYFELGIWQNYKSNTDDVTQQKVFQTMADQTMAKIKASKDLLEFIKKPYKDRVREVDTDMFQEIEPGEWQHIIRTLREYVVN